MTFPLTKTGRENLEVILAEFERAGRHYPPLYHERLIAWSKRGEVQLSDAQWQAFIDAESNDLDDSEWSEWDGPHPANPGFSGTYLGRWYGDPDGMPEFFTLVESLTAVLEREDFSTVDDMDLPFAFGSWIEWISTIHSWAFRFRLPLLSSSMNLWGAEDANQDDFYELSEQLSQTGDFSWPLHPVCWSLTYNVFTSSAAAIRAILRPDTVIALNEPWPCSEGNSKPLPPEVVDFVPPQSCHRIVHDAVGWHVHFAESLHPLPCSHKSGLQRIAVLIVFKGQEMKASQLSQYGGRPDKYQQSHRTIHKQEDFDGMDGLTVGKLPLSKQNKDDKDARRRAQDRLVELRRDEEDALQSKDTTVAKAIIAEIEDERSRIHQAYNVGEDDEVKPQRAFRDPQEQKAYDLVATTIKTAIKELKRKAPQHLKAIEELEYQIRLPRLVFEQKDHFTPWVVESHMGCRNQ